MEKSYFKIEEYKRLENEFYEEYKIKLHKLRTKYIEKNKKFNIGDYIYNITGIIKVDSIGYDIFGGCIEIKYSGYKYKKYKGKLSRTKDMKIFSIWESYNVKLLE